MLIQGLEALLAAVDTGSITGAAARLRCAQSVVSRRIQRLEREIGARLLVRQSSGVLLTSAGEQVVPFARDTLDAYAALVAGLHADEFRSGSTLRIAASTVPGEHLAPELVTRFTDQHPDARTRLSITDTAGVYRALLSRTTHVGFVGHRDAELSDRFTFVALAPDEIVLAVPAGHPFARLDRIAVADLAGQRLLTREMGSGTQRTFAEAIAGAGCALPATVTSVSLGSTQAVLSAVGAGLGIGVVSARVIGNHAPQVSPLRLAGVTVTRSLWVAYETARARTPLQAAFIAYVTRWATEDAVDR